nr:pilin [Chromohalobacter canadensis]
MPQYQNYVARSQFAEAHSLLGGAKISIQERVDQGQPVDLSNDLGIQMQGEYGAIDTDGGWSGEEGTNATVTYQFGSGDDATANANIDGQDVTYTYDPAEGTWECTTGIPQEYVSSCDPED